MACRPVASPPRLWLTARWLCAAAFLLLSACATGDFGPSPGGSPGGIYTPPPSARQDLQGTVSNVDHGNRRFLLREAGGARADIAYDGQTRLVYQGREQAVSGLEPGDQIRVRATRQGSLWRADDIEVLADARGPSGNGSYGGDAAERRGAISYVDARARRIGYTEGGYTGGAQSVAYDERTVVEHRGQRYPVRALERGDLVRIQLVRSANGWLAERVVVEVSARDR